MNGRPVVIDQIAAAGDIGRFLTPGGNTIAVRVATALNNRLANLDVQVAGRGLIQPYGLLRPVILTPYANATVAK